MTRETFGFISLHPGGYSHPLKCDLIRTSLANPLNYEKLSYAWGDPDLVSQIRVNGQELRIHRSLDIALRHIRLKHSPRLVWPDVICINQANISERSSQVAMMAQVYEGAGAVYNGLGPCASQAGRSHLPPDGL